MGKQFKVIKVSETWSIEKLRKKVEDALNKSSKEGWEIIDITYVANLYTAMITISK
ncbi:MULTISPECIES: DUF4177 domain-containing protein [Aquimarina]|uniref:DUF4177 domain-containing protein n=1 Tax=Aquimarina algiphila TaxID=2047982 RepID=A0A554VDY6_9FLAO|nr:MULTISPECIES: DUF4177 domain-containing protein [Aquimarina]TSE05128.1 DUF4177 domain-containing protein [Aquimarina algiphila]